MAMVTDPVCGMRSTRPRPRRARSTGGKTYYFCSEGCHQRFIAAPEQYAV
jgi:P-type Cu+ transporter